MLRIYESSLQLVREVIPLVRVIERHDADLARQCRRALSSLPLNLAEGSYSRGGNRTARYHGALGSVREALACLEVGEACQYLPRIPETLRGKFNHIIGTLVNLVVRK